MQEAVRNCHKEAQKSHKKHGSVVFELDGVDQELTGSFERCQTFAFFYLGFGC